MVVTDLGSTNGVYVDGQRVSQVQVTQPVLLGLGSTFISLRPDGLCEVQVAGGAGGELVGKDLTFRVNNGSMTLLDGISFSLPGNELLAASAPQEPASRRCSRLSPVSRRHRRGRYSSTGWMCMSTTR